MRVDGGREVGRTNEWKDGRMELGREGGKEGRTHLCI